MRNGLYFLHEHPATASSWQLDTVQSMMHRRGVHAVVGDICTFEMKQQDELGTAFIRKPTKFMTNSQCIANRLSQRCPGNHRRIQLINGRAKAAEVYPDKLCKAILSGLMEQMREDNRISQGNIGSVMAEEESSIDWKQYYDNLTGEKLNTDMVKAARQEEMQEVYTHKVHTKVQIEGCYEATGTKPIGTIWVDVNKGDSVHQEYRSRLVAQ